MNRRHCPVFVSKKNRGNAALHGPGSSRRRQTSFILERSFSACTSTIRWKLRVQGNHVICRVKFALEPLDDSDYGHRHEATIGIKLVSIPYPFPCSVVGWQLSCMYEVYLTSFPETYQDFDYLISWGRSLSGESLQEGALSYHPLWTTTTEMKKLGTTVITRW